MASPPPFLNSAKRGGSNLQSPPPQVNGDGTDHDGGRQMTEKELVLDNRSDPFLPSAVLGTLFRDPATNTITSFDLESLNQLGRLANRDIVDEAKRSNLISDDQHRRLQALLVDFNSAERRIFQHSKSRALMYGYDIEAERIILRNLVAINLFGKAVQILTPSEKTYVKLESGEVDLIGKLENGYVNLAAGMWSKFVPSGRHAFSYGTKRIWLSAVQDTADGIVDSIDNGIEIAHQEGIAHVVDANREFGRHSARPHRFLRAQSTTRQRRFGRAVRLDKNLCKSARFAPDLHGVFPETIRGMYLGVYANRQGHLDRR